jgi:hypothetical protein
MEPELMARLRALPREHLILLLEKLVARHATLSTDLLSLLDDLTALQADETIPFTVDDLAFHRTTVPTLSPQEIDVYRQRITTYGAQFQAGTSLQALFDEIVYYLQGAGTLFDRGLYLPALEIYEIIFDTRLSLSERSLILIFDRAIDEYLPELGLLLTEMSSLVILDQSSLSVSSESEGPLGKTTFLPQLSISIRQNWLKRLFYFWLNRLDDRLVNEQILDILHETMWMEDRKLMQQLILDAIAESRSCGHTNIVDFSQQSRIRHLERFMREFVPD